MKDCNFEVICNPHVTWGLACKDLRTHAHEKRRCEEQAKWCKFMTMRPNHLHAAGFCRAWCAFACIENRCIVTKEMHYMWCKMRNATMPRKRRLLLCKVRGAPRRAKAEPELLLKSADISPTSELLLLANFVNCWNFNNTCLWKDEATFLQKLRTKC